MKTEHKTETLDNIFRPGFDLNNCEKFAIKGFRDIRLVEDVGQNEHIVGVPVVGDCLKNIGILHGDLLILKITNESFSDKLSVWETPNGRTAKFATKNIDGTATLHNKSDWNQTWQTEEIELVGVVVRVERDLEVQND
jgi:hypothetical protein